MHDNCCYICYLPASKLITNLVPKPCKCKGVVVHPICLRQWMHFTQPVVRTCGICLSDFQTLDVFLVQCFLCLDVIIGILHVHFQTYLILSTLVTAFILHFEVWRLFQGWRLLATIAYVLSNIHNSLLIYAYVPIPCLALLLLILPPTLNKENN
jgi:hypothetical protein